MPNFSQNMNSLPLRSGKKLPQLSPTILFKLDFLKNCFLFQTQQENRIKGTEVLLSTAEGVNHIALQKRSLNANIPLSLNYLFGADSPIMAEF